MTVAYSINIPSEGKYRLHSQEPVGSRRMMSSGNRVWKIKNSLGEEDFDAVSCGKGRWKPGLCVLAQAAIYVVVLLVSAGSR